MKPQVSLFFLILLIPHLHHRVSDSCRIVAHLCCVSSRTCRTVAHPCRLTFDSCITIPILAYRLHLGINVQWNCGKKKQLGFNAVRLVCSSWFIKAGVRSQATDFLNITLENPNSTSLALTYLSAHRNPHNRLVSLDRGHMKESVQCFDLWESSMSVLAIVK